MHAHPHHAITTNICMCNNQRPPTATRDINRLNQAIEAYSKAIRSMPTEFRIPLDYHVNLPFFILFSLYDEIGFAGIGDGL